MQRIAALLVCACALPSGTGVAQDAAGTMLWRLAGTTLAVPPALALGPAATFWNPAQAGDTGRTELALEGIQTPAAIRASGLIAAVRLRARPLGAGRVGLVYGRVGLSDLTRTADSPDPIGGTVPVFTQLVGINWARLLGGTAVGATLALHETRLDTSSATRVTFDVGASRAVGTRVRVAAATHFFSSFSAADPAQDFFGGVEVRLWQGSLWQGSGGAPGTAGILRARYGIAFGHGFAADHHAGLGLDVGSVVSVDAALAREGSYASHAWRPIGAVRVVVGKYGILLARDGGVSALGSGYRVGLDARFP